MNQKQLHESNGYIGKMLLGVRKDTREVFSMGWLNDDGYIPDSRLENTKDADIFVIDRFLNDPIPDFGNGKRVFIDEILKSLPLHDFRAAKPVPSIALKYPQYYKNVRHLDYMDVYAVHQVFGVSDPSGAIHHASKKLLLSGVRTGGKPAYEDVKEARDTLTRYLELHGAEQTEKKSET